MTRWTDSRKPSTGSRWGRARTHVILRVTQWSHRIQAVRLVRIAFLDPATPGYALRAGCRMVRVYSASAMSFWMRETPSIRSSSESA
ncbi:hypothetical protein SAMN06298212_12318 [Ruaniaceae bacterium KH17]|nr:hypothetical protein SAMN06298212_12318 [Ruaniaceae bacterium KH17]